MTYGQGVQASNTTTQAAKACPGIKDTIANVALLYHSSTSTGTSIIVDATDQTARVFLEQLRAATGNMLPFKFKFKVVAKGGARVTMPHMDGRVWKFQQVRPM